MHTFAHGDSEVHNRHTMPKGNMIWTFIKNCFSIEGIFGGTGFFVFMNAGGWKESVAIEVLHFVLSVFGGILLLIATYIVKVEFGPWYEKRRHIFRKKPKK